MTDDNHTQAEADRALVHSMQARLCQFGHDEARLVDAFMMRLEHNRLANAELVLTDANTYPCDVAVALIAKQVMQREADARQRLAEIEAEEMPAYGGGR